MSGIGEASLVLGLVSSIITVIETCHDLSEALADEKGLPKTIRSCADKLPLICSLLEEGETYIKGCAEEKKTALEPVLKSCDSKAKQLKTIFDKICPEENVSRWDRYVKAAKGIGKGGRVEDLVNGIMDDLQLMTTKFPDIVKSDRAKDKFQKALNEMKELDPTLPDGFEKEDASILISNYGSGLQNVNTGTGDLNSNSGSGQQFIGKTQNFGAIPMLPRSS
jgi:alkaline phosphatase